MKKFLSFALKPEWKNISIITVLAIVQTVLQLAIIELFKVSLNQIKTKDVHGVVHNGELMILLTFVLVVVLIIDIYLINKVTSNAAYRTRKKIFHILTYLPLDEVNKFKHTGLMSRTTRGIFSSQGFITFVLRDLLPLPFIAIGVILEIYIIDPKFAAGFTVFVAIIMTLFIYKIKEIVEIYFAAKKTYGTINHLFREKITGAKTIRIFQKQEFESDKFKESSLNSYEKSVKSLLSQYYVAPLVVLTFDIVLVLLLGYLFVFYSIDSIISHEEMTNFIVILQFVIYFISNLAFLTKFVEHWPKSYATSVRLEEVLTIEDKIVEKENKVKKSDFEGIEFKHVSFTKDNREVIKDVSFKIPAKSSVAIVGGPSSGKTTLMYMLDKLSPISEGEILINGFDINDCTCKDVRSQISFAMQKDFVLNDTVCNNITMGDKTITQEEIDEACRQSGLDELFIKENMDLNSQISENGLNITGEFKQKLTLARALAHNREIYIFEEYAYIKNNKTNIILTQNVDEIKDIDHIIVLEDGKVVGEGNHEKLLENCGSYQKLYLGGGAC